MKVHTNAKETTMNVELLKAHANGLPEMLGNAEALAQFLRGLQAGNVLAAGELEEMVDDADDLAADLATLCAACEDE